MKYKEIEYRLREEMKDLAPFMLDELLSDCEDESSYMGSPLTVIPNPSRSIRRRIAAIAAAFVLVFSAAISGGIISSRDCVVSVDVNPSIELEVNGLGRVREVHLLNDDAGELLDENELKNEKVTEALSLITSGLCESGYISVEHNGMLISVRGLEGKYAERFCDKLITAAGTGCGDCAILYQDIGGSEDLPETPSDMSAGKALLVGKLGGMTDALTEEDIRSFSIQQLLTIVVDLDRLPDNTRLYGDLKGYCSAVDAEAIAVGDLNPDSGMGHTVQLIRYGEELAYKVLFNESDNDIGYIISAATGDIIDILRIIGDQITSVIEPSETGSDSGELLHTPSDALDALFGMAGLLLGDLSQSLDNVDVSQAVIHGIPVYAISYELNGETQTLYISKITGNLVYP